MTLQKLSQCKTFKPVKDGAVNKLIPCAALNVGSGRYRTRKLRAFTFIVCKLISHMRSLVSLLCGPN